MTETELLHQNQAAKMAEEWLRQYGPEEYPASCACAGCCESRSRWYMAREFMALLKRCEAAAQGLDRHSKNADGFCRELEALKYTSVKTIRAQRREVEILRKLLMDNAHLITSVTFDPEADVFVGEYVPSHVMSQGRTREEAEAAAVDALLMNSTFIAGAPTGEKT